MNKQVIINGIFQQYDYCAENKDDYDEYPVIKDLIYLGEGIMCGRQYHFWKLRAGTEDKYLY